MTKFEDAFLDLVHRVNDDPIKVFDDALTYVLCQLSTGEVKVAYWTDTTRRAPRIESRPVRYYSFAKYEEGHE